MPVKIRKLPGQNKWRVYDGGKIKSEHTSHANAIRQANLLRGVKHGFKPTGKKAKK